MMGRAEEAERILTRAEAVAPLGLFPEEVDARTGRHLGNGPLLFSQIEYVRAALTLAEARRRLGARSPQQGRGGSYDEHKSTEEP